MRSGSVRKCNPGYPPGVSLHRLRRIAMNQDLAVALGWIGCAIALFSFLGVRSWVNAQRREREAYYKSEAIKKIAEMQGAASEPVLALLREALKPPPEAP